jgi:transcriptional regulator EpsA
MSLASAAIPARNFELTEAEAARFLRIVADSLPIRRHCQLFAWLSGELQQFLPHQILISAWGDFARWNLKLDVVSGLPGVRTAALADCSIDDIVRDAYTHWIEAGRRPLVLSRAEAAVPHCACHLHSAIRSMRSLLVHGVVDERGGYDSLYLVLSAGSITGGRCADRFTALVDSLVVQIDAACRRVGALPLANGKRAEALGLRRLDLSSREREILDWVCGGSTNGNIAAGLDISPFTVKNHVQRIFRKIGASNRTQAAAKYNLLRGFGRGPAKASP